MNQFIYKYNRLHASRFNVSVKSCVTCKLSPIIKKKKKKNEIRAGKLTHGFRCRLNYAASIGCGADDGLDLGDVASFVVVLSQKSSCAPSVGDHTF